MTNQNGSYVAGIRLDAFTYDDFQLMLDALETHANKSSSSSIMGLMMGTILSRSKEEAEELAEHQRKEEQKREHEVRRLRESVAILRSKLILMRRELDSQEAERILEQANTAAH